MFYMSKGFHGTVFNRKKKQNQTRSLDDMYKVIVIFNVLLCS